MPPGEFISLKESMLVILSTVWRTIITRHPQKSDIAAHQQCSASLGVEGRRKVVRDVGSAARAFATRQPPQDTTLATSGP